MLYATTQKTRGVADPRDKSNYNEEQDERDLKSSSAENNLEPPLGHGVTAAVLPRRKTSRKESRMHREDQR